MILKRPILSDPSTVDRILQEIRATGRPGEFVTICELRDRLFDSVQITKAELVHFAKVHGGSLFEKYPRREHRGLRCDNYLMKAPTESLGRSDEKVNSHG